MAKLEDLITENGRYVVELERPILIEGESQSRLLLKAPTLAHIMELERLKSDSERTISLICALADIPPSSARAITVRDLKLHIEPVIEVLMGESRETGET